MSTAAAYRSRAAGPKDRGYEFGRLFATEIEHNVRWYGELFRATGRLDDHDVTRLGAAALEATGAWAPALQDEIVAIAAGASIRPELIGALNARTEILGYCRAINHECTVAVALGGVGSAPIATQTWDWHDALAAGWLVWTIEHPSGRVVHTLTEYGIVGKLGVCSSGLALLLNILRHTDDGNAIGTPIHVIARRVLDEAEDLNQALLLIGSAAPSASSAMTLVACEAGAKAALSVEVWPGGPAYVLPDKEGLLVHTNHFLDPRGAAGDREPILGPDSFFRYDVVRRGLSSPIDAPPDVIKIFRNHLGGAGAICCHPDPGAPVGERYATLATIDIDLEGCHLNVHPGGPCSHPRNSDEATANSSTTWTSSVPTPISSPGSTQKPSGSTSFFHMNPERAGLQSTPET
jgi:isopenicillin-N N-acyltransferase like protein